MLLHPRLVSTCESCGHGGTPLANLYHPKPSFQAFECFHIFLAGLSALPNHQTDATHADLCSPRNAIVTISTKRALKTLNGSKAVKRAPVWDRNAPGSLKIAHYIFLNLAVSGASVKRCFCFQHVHVCKAQHLLTLTWCPRFQTPPGLLSPTYGFSPGKCLFWFVLFLSIFAHPLCKEPRMLLLFILGLLGVLLAKRAQFLRGSKDNVLYFGHKQTLACA